MGKLDLQKLLLHLLLNPDVELFRFPFEQSLVDVHGEVPVRDLVVPYLAANLTFKYHIKVLSHVIVLVNLSVGIYHLIVEIIRQFSKVFVPERAGRVLKVRLLLEKFHQMVCLLFGPLRVR